MAETTTNAPQAKQEERFDRDYLAERARTLFGASAATVRGALSRGTTKTYTLADAKKLVREHAKTPAEHAGGEDA